MGEEEGGYGMGWSGVGRDGQGREGKFLAWDEQVVGWDGNGRVEQWDSRALLDASHLFSPEITT